MPIYVGRELYERLLQLYSQGKTMNWNKPFETKSGLKARLLGVCARVKNDPYNQTHVCAVMNANGNEDTRIYNSAGQYCGPSAPSSFDLHNPPTEVSTREAFAHVYELADGTHRLGSMVYPTKQAAIEGRNALLSYGRVQDVETARLNRYADPGKHLGVTKLNTRVKIEE